MRQMKLTLLTAAVLAFPATIREKLTGLVLGVLWLQAWNVVRIGTLVIADNFIGMPSVFVGRNILGINFNCLSMIFDCTQIVI